MIKVLHKAFDLLESMSANKERVFSLRELASIIEEKPTTCANIVKTLCDRGYLCRVGRGGYMLGPLARGLSFEDSSDVRLIELLKEPMMSLVERYGASGVLAVLRHGKKKILEDYKSTSELMINRTVRGDHELYTTSTGLCLTSRDGEHFLAEKKTIIEETFGSVEAMLDVRERIVRDGYVAISLRPQVYEIAAVIEKDGRVYASIAVYLPSMLLDEEKKNHLIQELCTMANAVEERI